MISFRALDKIIINGSMLQKSELVEMYEFDKIDMKFTSILQICCNDNEYLKDIIKINEENIIEIGDKGYVLNVFFAGYYSENGKIKFLYNFNN